MLYCKMSQIYEKALGFHMHLYEKTHMEVNIA
jgi:hypothetical protein